MDTVTPMVPILGPYEDLWENTLTPERPFLKAIDPVFPYTDWNTRRYYKITPGARLGHPPIAWFAINHRAAYCPHIALLQSSMYHSTREGVAGFSWRLYGCAFPHRQ